MWSDSGHFIPVEFTHYCQLTVYKTRSCCDVMEFLDTWNSLPIISKIDPNWNYFHETHNNVWKIISIRQLSYACSRCMYFSTFYSLIMNAKASKSCLSLLRQYVNVNIWVHFWYPRSHCYASYWIKVHLATDLKIFSYMRLASIVLDYLHIVFVHFKIDVSMFSYFNTYFEILCRWQAM